MASAVASEEQSGEFEIVETAVSLGRYTRSGMSQPFVVLPEVYRPDEWTSLTIEAALTALRRFPDCRHIHDVGCGTGIIPLVLGRLHPDRRLSFLCSDVKPAAGRNLALNHDLFGGAGHRPDFRQVGVTDDESAPTRDEPPDLVIANIPQLPAGPAGDGGPGWNPDDYHTVQTAEPDDPIHAFGLGLLMDVLAETRKNHPGRFAAVFCRTSRIPDTVFDTFLDRVHGSIVHQGPEHLVRDGSTPFAVMAEAEDRFNLSGRYEWRGASVPARALRDHSPDREVVFIGLRGCLVEIG